MYIYYFRFDREATLIIQPKVCERHLCFEKRYRTGLNYSGISVILLTFLGFMIFFSIYLLCFWIKKREQYLTYKSRIKCDAVRCWGRAGNTDLS